MSLVTITHFFALVALAVYSLVLILSLFELWKQKREQGKLPAACYLIGLGFHTASLCLLFSDPGSLFLENGADSYYLASWLFALSLGFYRKKLGFPIIFALSTPVIVALMASSSYLLHTSAESQLDFMPPSNVTKALLAFHMVPALIAIVSIILAFVVGVAFLFVEGRIRSRSKSALSFGGPNLAFLDSLNRYLTLSGLIAISLVIISGVSWSVLGHKKFLFDASILATSVVWVLLASIVTVRVLFAWSARRIAKLTVFTSLLFLLSLFVLLFGSGSLIHRVY